MNPIIDLRKYVEHGSAPILFSVQHDKIQTVFNVTGIQNMYLLGFKFSNRIKSVNLINGRKEHVFQLAIPSKTLLFLPKKLILESNSYLLVKRPSIEKFLNDVHSIQILPTLKKIEIMKNITQITTVFSLLIICNSYSQNTVDPNNTIEEKTIFTVLEENGKTKYFGQFYKNKKRALALNFWKMVKYEQDISKMMNSWENSS